ncbi:poly [ADP-ribose] polymerase-like protein, partial [Dinothrombium tinctorium]
PISDSGSYENEYISEISKKRAHLVVDPDSGLDRIAHVYQDQNGPYSVNLIKVNIALNKNSYYKIQLLESNEAKKKHQYWVYKAWGRIGTDIGKSIKKHFEWKSDAIKHFCEVFLDRTGNEWKNKNEFKKRPGDYHIVETHYGNTENGVFTFDNQLPNPIRDLILMIFNIGRIENQMKEFNLDFKKMLSGDFSKDRICKAYSVLDEISNMIETNEKSCTKMSGASNRFYSLIPHDFGTDTPIIIKDKKLLQEKLEMLDSLLHMEVAFETILDAHKENEDNIKRLYDRLDANIE